MATSQLSSFETGLKIAGNDIDKLLEFCTLNGCSDLFVKVGEVPHIYRYGILYQGNKIIDSISWNKFTNKALTSEMQTEYVRNKMFDFSYTVKNHRYRVNVGYSVGKCIATFRMISDKLPTFESLKIDKQVITLLEEAFKQKSGVSFLVGATGSGKTSTLAACINSFSSTYGSRSGNEVPLTDAHLITLEDPIEYIYPTKPRTRIIQKELNKDFKSFELGIKSALREHPTHILVGETRDKETIRALVEAARTGHQVLSTFHVQSVSGTIARLYSYLASENMDIMYDLVDNLNFILAQKLIKGRKGYKLQYQYMFFTPEIKKVLVDAIVNGKNIPRTIDSLMVNEKIVKANLAHDWSEA